MSVGSAVADTLQDMGRAVERLRAGPRFAFAVIGTLALGIGITTAMFSLVNGIVLRPLPFPQADRLVSVFASNTSQGWSEAPVSVPDFQDWSAHSRGVRPMAAVHGRAVMVGDPSGGDAVVGAVTSAALFRMLGADPLIGRDFVADDDKAGAPCTVVLSRRFWVTRFGSDPALIEKSLTVDDHVCTVVGVLPDIDLPDVGAPSVWLPFGVGLERWRQAGIVSKRAQRFLTIIGKLTPGTTLNEAKADLSGLAAQLALSYPITNREWGAGVVPLKARVLGGSRPALLMLFGAVGLILLIGCANVANLLLARGAMRQHEFALRLALGAGRAHLARQLLAESVAFSLVGGGCGLALASGMIRLLHLVAPHALPRLGSVRIDTTAMVFTVAISMLAALASGFAPAVSAIRVAARHSLSQGDRTATGGSRARRFRNGLMGVESALAVVLLTGGMLALESYWTLDHVQLGFAPHHVLTATITPSAAMDMKQRLMSYEEAVRAVASLPGVESVGATQVPPLMNSQWTTSFAIVGQPSPAHPFMVSYVRLAGPYFHTMRVPLLNGRYFDERDDAAGRATVIVNDAFARLFFPEGHALGARLAIWDSHPPYEIVGIVGNTIQRALESTQDPMLYVRYAQAPGGSYMTLVVRAARRDAGVRTAIRRAVSAAAGPGAIANVTSMDESVAAALTPHRYTAMLLGLFAALALALACVGVYGVVAHATAQRTREMGIRIALGALPTSVVAVVMRQALWVVGAGAVVGVVASLWLAKATRSIVYDAGRSDALVFIAVPCLLLCVTALAAYVPARRASRIDPLIALRNQ